MLLDVEAIARFFSKIEALGLRSAVGGSIASSLWSNPRTTNDLDVTLCLERADVDAFVAAFESDYIVSRGEIHEALSLTEWPRMFQLLEEETGFRVDVFLFDDTEYARSEISRVVVVPVKDGVFMKLLAPENIVLRKLLWYQLGNRVSDRQWNDIMGVIEVQGPAFDREYVRKWARDLGVLDLAEEALAEAKDY